MWTGRCTKKLGLQPKQTCDENDHAQRPQGSASQTHLEDTPSPSPSPSLTPPRTAESDGPSTATADGSEAERGPGVQLQGSNVADTDTDASSQDDRVQGGMRGATCVAPSSMPRIRTVEEGQACLEKAQLIELDDMLNLVCSP